MKQILRINAHHKTADAIKLCIDNNAVLVTPFDPDYIQSEAHKLYNTQIRIVQFRDFLTGRLKGCRDEKFVIDDVDECLRELVGHNDLIGIALNME